MDEEREIEKPDPETTEHFLHQSITCVDNHNSEAETKNVHAKLSEFGLWTVYAGPEFETILSIFSSNWSLSFSFPIVIFSASESQVTSNIGSDIRAYL